MNNDMAISANAVKSPLLSERIENARNNIPIQPQPKVDLELASDKVEITKKEEKTEEKPKKKGILEKTANFIGSIKKGFVKFAGYAKGGVKGIGSFAVGGTATVGTIFTVNKFRQGAKIAKETGANKVASGFTKLFEGISNNFKPANLKKTLKSPKGIGTVIAGVAVGSLAFMYQIYKAKLAVNKKNAELDHKYFDSPHVTKK